MKDSSLRRYPLLDTTRVVILTAVMLPRRPGTAPGMYCSHRLLASIIFQGRSSPFDRLDVRFVIDVGLGRRCSKTD